MDCWQCFDNKGRICHQKDYKNMFNYTNRTSPAIGICCRGDYYDGFCADNHPELQCSMRSYDSDEDSIYKNVLSNGNRNHQMFAFCPNINQQTCGISDDN